MDQTMSASSAAQSAGARERLARVAMPEAIARLPRDKRGYPVPAFVLWRDGVPDFRIMDHEHLARCVRQGQCWICGEPLTTAQSFVIGPMCSVNRISSEPPSHLICARYAAQVCPFLAIPAMRRIEHNMPEGATAAGIPLARNPGACCIWMVTDGYRLMHVDNGVLFQFGDPSFVEWWCEGRYARRSEILASIDSGMPALRGIDGPGNTAAQLEIDKAYAQALRYLPAE